MTDERSVLPVHDPRRGDRVREHTAPEILADIDRRTATRVMRVARGGEAAIARRLDELDREWDVERAVTLGIAGVSLVAELGARRPVVRAVIRALQVALVAHAVAGRGPATALVRRLGVRTQKEIDAERAVLVELLHLMDVARAEEETVVVVEEADLIVEPEARP